MPLATDRDNPYTPPESRVADPENEPGSPLKAIAVGLAVDIGGTFMAGLVLVFAYGIALGASGVGADEAATALANISPYSWVSAAGFAAGSGFSVLGGYLCARIVKRSEHKVGAILAALSTIVGMLASMGSYSPLANFILAAAGFAMVMIGVQMGYAKNRRIAREGI
jgi:hypothetical protein